MNNTQDAQFFTGENFDTQVDLSDMDARIDNIDSLADWHPNFHLIKGDIEKAVELFSDAMKKYKTILLETGEDLSELENHVQEEVTIWTLDRMSEQVSTIWTETSSKKSD
jgi:hypothetical protein